MQPKPDTAPVLVIHAGAGRALAVRRAPEIAAALRSLAERVHQTLVDGGSALDAVVGAVQALENDPRFNAGTGARLQIDGRARLSAAVMDGSTERFGGVVNVEGLPNPVLLSRALIDDEDRVLANQGALSRARELRLDEGDVRTPQRIKEWEERTGQPLPPLDRTGTVGAVALDRTGRLAAATSTGGRGFEAPGRVSDTPTVAATYANDTAAVSLTGVGENIVDGALAARLVAKVECGLSLAAAAEQLMDQQRRRLWQAGFIAISADGTWAAEHSTPGMSWWAVDNQASRGFLE